MTQCDKAGPNPADCYAYQGITEGVMKYPKEFTADLQARVEAEIIRGRIEFKKRRSSSGYLSGPSWDTEQLLIAGILKGFLAFAREAFKLGKQGSWTVSRIDMECLEFLRRLAIEAKSGTGYGENWISNWTGGITDFFSREYEKSPLWNQYQEELLKLAEFQAERASTHAMAEKEDNKPTGNIPELLAMENLNWSEIQIGFEKAFLRIRARKFIKRLHFAALGFQDGRRGDSANSEWSLLACLAANNGRIPRENDLPRELAKNLPKWISKLRKRLNAWTGIQGDPLPWKDGLYQSQFRIELSAAIEQKDDEGDEIKEAFEADAHRFTKHLTRNGENQR